MAKSDYRFASTLNPYGLDKNNNLVRVDDVPNGLDCGCVCPTCKVDLIAKQGDEREHHFAHRCDDNSCLHIQETYFLRMKEILERNMRIMLPWYRNRQPIEVSLKSISFEDSVDKRILPDLVAETEEGDLIHIRFKRKKGKDLYVDDDIIYLELDANDVKINDLEAFLLSSADNKKWINYDNIIEEDCQKNFKGNLYFKRLNNLQRRIKKELQDNEYCCKNFSFCLQTCRYNWSCPFLVKFFVYDDTGYVLCNNPDLYFKLWFPNGVFLDFQPKNEDIAIDEYEAKLAKNKHFTKTTRIYDWDKNDNQLVVQHIDDFGVLYATKVVCENGKYVFTEVDVF